MSDFVRIFNTPDGQICVMKDDGRTNDEDEDDSHDIAIYMNNGFRFFFSYPTLAQRDERWEKIAAIGNLTYFKDEGDIYKLLKK